MAKVKHYIVKPQAYIELMDLARGQVEIRRISYQAALDTMGRLEGSVTAVTEDSIAEKPVAPSIKVADRA